MWYLQEVHLHINFYIHFPSIQGVPFLTPGILISFCLRNLWNFVSVFQVFAFQLSLFNTNSSKEESECDEAVLLFLIPSNDTTGPGLAS